MAVLKLYFVTISEGSQVEVSVHRDLDTLNEVWRQTDQANCVGIIHISFVRPKIQNAAELLRHRGKVLITIAAKWALPEGYRSSVAVIGEMKLHTQLMPLYRLLKGMGCHADEPVADFESSAATVDSEGKLTIAEAALQVLNDSSRPLNQEEIFARIIEQNLYRFSMKKPVSVLAIELSRHSKNTEYSNPATKPLFCKMEDGYFYSLECEKTERSGWVKQLADDRPDLAVLVGSYGVYNEKMYDEIAGTLPSRLREQADLYRFRYLFRNVNSNDPQSLINVLPHCILTAPIVTLEFPIRVLNVLKGRGVDCIGDLYGVPVETMLKWPNFGRKSVEDFCLGVIVEVERLDSQLALGVNVLPVVDTVGLTENNEENNEAYQIELVSALPLKKQFERTLIALKDSHRQIIEFRTGYNGTVLTLEAVGELVGVTRERVRQIQKKYVTQIIEREFWDDCIALKIGQLLIDRNDPLYIEMLEVEDAWFEGFMGNYQHLAAIIELFSENEIRVLKINGASVVTRIRSEVWEDCVSHFRNSLKDKATEGVWTKDDIDMTFRSGLSDKGAPELVPLMWEEFAESLQFDGEAGNATLLTFGISAESVVHAVLLQAECPLHYSEIAVRASVLLGKSVDERRAQSALTSQGAKLYGRGIYGLEKFNPISPRMCNNICLVVCNIIYDGPLMKQWHSSEILTSLKTKFSNLPEELDSYILNIILQSSDRLVYLNRMVWTRADSNQSVDDRVDMADAFTQILEENGGPLKGREIKERLAKIRGVSKSLQLQPTERMIQIGPDFWGLVERDIGGTELGNLESLDRLYKVLQERQKGIHVSEVEHFVDISENSAALPSAYALFNLAQRDERFHLGRSMFLGLAEWGRDTRRMNYSQAIRLLLSNMSEPMSLSEISASVEDLTGLAVDSSVTSLLIKEGAVYSQETRTWFKD